MKKYKVTETTTTIYEVMIQATSKEKALEKYQLGDYNEEQIEEKYPNDDRLDVEEVEE